MKKIKFTALILVFTLLFTAIQPAAWAAAAGQTADGTETAPGDTVQSPENGKWSYIYFGSYPQTEVKGDNLTDAIKNASYDANGDATVDGGKYHRIYTRRYPAGILNESEGTDEYFYYKWEPIRWRVLQKTEDALFVMADKGLDYIPYHTAETAVTWDNSQIRDWLNSENTGTLYDSGSYMDNQYFSYSFYMCENGNDGYRHYVKDDNKQEKVHSFYTTAFDDAQRAAITAQGNDKLFLLSAEDVKNASYGFGTTEKLPARQLSVSEYAEKKSSYVSTSAWWLRSDNAPFAAIVGSGGDIISNSEYFKVNNYGIACAPAMYISLSSDQWVSEAAQLAGYKEDALNTLYAYQTSKYRTAEDVSMLKAVKEGRDAINQAKDNTAVDNALAAAEAKIGRLKTAGEYNWEEAIAAGASLNPVHHHDTSMKDSGETNYDVLSSEANPDYTDWHYIYFGKYPQSKVTDAALKEELSKALQKPENVSGHYVKYNGHEYCMGMYNDANWYMVEPLKWRILQVEENQLFVVSDTRLLDEKIATSQTSTGWGSCPTEIYLNTDDYQYFMGWAFSSEKEKEAIVPYNITEYNKPCDYKIYLLTKEEAVNEEYGFCRDEKLCSRSRQMPSKSEWGKSSTTCWLRGYDKTTKKFNTLKKDGSVGTSTNFSVYSYGVVPALRLSLDKEYAPYWSMSEPTSDADIKAVLDARDGLDALYSEKDYSAAQWAKIQESLDGMLERMIAGEQEITDIVEETKQELDEIPNKQQEEQSGLQDAKAEAKAELEAYREENDKYTEEQQQERESIITTGIAAIEEAQDADAVTAALNKAKEDLAKIVPGGGTEDPKLPEELEETLRDRTFQTIDGKTQGMYSESHELTIEVFADIGCGYSDMALKYLQQMNLPTDKADIFSIDTSGASKEEVQSHVAKLNTPNITHCYDAEKITNWGSQAASDMMSYAYYFADGVAGTPLYVFRDSTGEILNVTAGWQDTTKLTELLISLGYTHLLPEEQRPDGGTTIEAEFDVTYGQTEARQMLSRINDLRTGEDAWEWNSTDTEKILHTGLGELTYDYELEKVAMQRAAELVAAYSHTRPDETSCFTAYPSAFDNMSKGENIAIGTGNFSEEQAFTGWREEDKPYSGQGHRRNMLNEGFQTVGIAHVTYNGCHYWVQEFGGSVVSDEATQANDSKTTVKVSISKNAIRTQELKTEVQTIEMKAGENQPLPQVYNTVRTQEAWAHAPSLEFPVTAVWSVSSGEDAVRISAGKIYALKEGETEVTASYNGKEAKIQVIVTESLTKEDCQEKRNEALNELEALEKKLGEYRATEQKKIRDAIEEAKIKIAEAKDVNEVKAALEAVNQVVKEQPTDAQLTEKEKEEENKNNSNKVKKITVSAPSKKIAAGKKVALSAKVTPSNAKDRRVQWSVNNKKYASVTPKGVVTVKKAGAGKSVKVTATALDGSGTKGTITISIMKGAVKKVKLKAAGTVKAGKKLKVKAAVSVTNKKANKALKWESSNKKYATVSKSGVVTAKKTGKGKKVKITATATDGTNKKASVTIKIK